MIWLDNDLLPDSEISIYQNKNHTAVDRFEINSMYPRIEFSEDIEDITQIIGI